MLKGNQRNTLVAPELVQLSTVITCQQHWHEYLSLTFTIVFPDHSSEMLGRIGLTSLD